MEWLGGKSSGLCWPKTKTRPLRHPHGSTMALGSHCIGCLRATSAVGCPNMIKPWGQTTEDETKRWARTIRKINAPNSMLVVIIVENHIKLSIPKRNIYCTYFYLRKRKMFLDFQKKEISKPAHWRKSNLWKKYRSTLSGRWENNTGISTLQQIRNLLVVILLVSNPEHWRK